MVVRIALISILTLLTLSSAVLGQVEGRDQLLHYSLQVDIDEEARTQLAASETELVRGDVLAAVTRWRAMLDSGRPGSLVPFRGAFASVPRAISSLVRSLPAAVGDEYLRITEPIAARAFVEATGKDDSAALWGVIDRFPRTDAAIEACVQLAERCFDAGRFAECRLAVDRWFDEVKDAQVAVAGRPQMAMWRRLSLLALGDVEGADARWVEFAAEIPPDLKQVVASHETARLSPAREPGLGHAGPVKDVTEVLPSEDVIWSVPLAGAPDREWGSIAFDFEELAQPLLMVGRPVVTPNGLLVSGTGHGLIDTATGAVKWGLVGAAAGSGSRRDALESIREALGEAITGRLTLDGDRVMTVQPLQNGRPRTEYADQLDVNSLNDGSQLQVVQEFPVPSSNDPQRASVLGPAGSGHSQVYAVLQVDQQLSLAAFDSNPLKARWRTRLGDAGLSLLVDHRRRWMPAVVDASGDSVLCATGNGGVVSLEPGRGRVQWIHRSEREDWRNAGPPPMSTPASAPRLRMWTGWREPVLKRIGEVVIWAGPEANSLTGLDRRTGEVRWSHPRGDGLAVVVSDAKVMVISEESVRRVNAADGATMWSTPIGLPAGVGFTAGAWYVQPLRSGGSTAVRLEDGAVTRSVAWGTEVLKQPRTPLEELRSLTWTPQGIVVQTPRSISLHPTVASVRESRPQSAGRAQWLAAAGRMGDAEKAVADSGDGAGLQRTRLQLIARETADNQFHPVARPFERLEEVTVGRDVEERVGAFLNDRRPETAIELLAGVSLRELSAVWVESNRKPQVRMRADVLAAGTILERPASADASTLVAVSPAGRARLDDLLKRVAAARPEEVPLVLSLLSRSDWGSSLILERSQSTVRGPGGARELARRRLALLALESVGGDVAARAAQLGASLAPQMMPLTDWPKGDAVRADERDRKSVIGQWPVQFTPLIGSELRGLSIDVLLTGFGRRNVGLGVHFSGCGEDRPWEIDLPRTDRSLGQSTDYRHGIGVGPLVLMQSSTGLHGLLPFDAAGERGASTLWDVRWIDMWGKVTTHSVNYLPRLSDVAPGRHPLDLDDFGRPLAQVGPVTASFFCYREFGRLVCCDTATGRRRWDRGSLGPDDIAVGDENAVIVVSPASKRVEILDPLDGELVATRPVEFAGRHWRTAIDTTAYLRSGAREVTAIPVNGPEETSEIVALDLKSGQRRWKQAIDPAAVEFMVGRRLVGSVDAKAIQFFDPVDGSEKKKVPIEAPAEIVDVYAIDDPFAVMVGVFGKPAVDQLKPPLQLLGNRRKPYANGIVYGFDPETLELKWSIPMEKSVFPLDQPRDLPLLVIWDALIAPPTAELRKRIEKDVQGTYDIREDRIRCFDKRTGKQVGGDLMGMRVGSTGIVIERSQREGWVEVRTSKGVFRFEVGGGK